MGTYVILVLVFCGGLLPWVYIALLFCLLAGVVVQCAALLCCRRFGRWLFPALLAVLWLVLDLVASNAVNYAQMFSLLGLGATIFCFLGAALGSALWFVCRAVQRKNKSAE